jgi:hypothetical protein
MRPVTGSSVLALLLASTPAARAAEPVVRVEHRPFACVPAGAFAKVQAAITPQIPGLEARVLFRAEGCGVWYGVSMQPEGTVWTATLPRPLPTTTRVHYVIEVKDGVRRRLPAGSGHYVADVVSGPCSGDLQTAPTVAAAEIVLAVPEGADREAPGFEPAGIAALVALEEAPPATADRAVPVATGIDGVAVGDRVRVATRSPKSGVPGRIVYDEGGAAIFARAGEEGQPPRALARSGRLRGKLLAVDDQVLTVALDGERTVRVARADVARLEVSSGDAGANLRVLGGLAGAAAGFAIGILACTTGDLCSDIAPVWIATAAGMGIGIGASPGGERWRAVDLGGVRLGLAPAPGGAALKLGLSF